MDFLYTGISKVDAIYFHKPDEEYGFLSNWYQSEFEVDGKKFTSCEQFIMYQKCKILGEYYLANQIMSTDDPAVQKELARNTAKYNERLWAGRRQAVAVRGLYAKFSQNEELKEKLLATNDAYLVEASWTDRTWACGISMKSEDRKEMTKWRGANILGFALMEVRNMLGNSGSNEPKTSITIKVADITTLSCDAIVNAAKTSLLGGGGVDGAIHKAAGPELLAECETLNGCKTGQAKITAGYKLPAKHVIHTVGPVYSGKSSDEFLLACCYENSLSLARDKDIHSIAFPAISTGVYGYPIAEATQVAVNTVKSWVERNDDYEMDIIFCCYSESDAQVYRIIMDETN